VPKFRNPLLARWMARLGRPEVRVRLDAEGSFVWAQCDGATTVIQIAERLHARAGGDAAQLRDRVAGFVERLARDGLVTLDHPGGTA
jgi:hypothetical protein